MIQDTDVLNTRSVDVYEVSQRIFLISDRKQIETEDIFYVMRSKTHK